MSRGTPDISRGVRVVVGVVLGLLSLTPAYLLLNHPGTGLFGEGTVAIAASNLVSTWLGIAVTVGLGLVLGIVLPRRRLASAIDYLRNFALGVPLGRWVVCLSVGSAVLARVTDWCRCGSPFDLEAVPNFARQVAEAGLDWPPPAIIRLPAKDW